MATWFYPGQEDYITKLNDLAAIAGLKTGPQGWTPELAIVNDGERRVMQVVDWFDGAGTKPTTGQYVGVDGLVGNISLGINIRGPQGGTGSIGPSNVLSIGSVVGGVTADATITGTSPAQVLNLVLPKGDNGLNGWSPVLAVTTNGERRVLEVVDWVGGQGVKPANLGYIGVAGIVVNIAQAVDIRGPSGAGTGNVNPTGVIAANDLAAFADSTGQVIKALKAADLPVSTATQTALDGKAPLNGTGTSGTWPISTTGNAATATKLATARTINGTAFDGSANISVSVGWASVTGKPAVIAAGADAAAARTAIGAGTSNLAEAPSDGKTYGRKNAAWVEAGGAGRDAGSQLYTTSQSIPKSTFGTAAFVLVELWGGGGSGQAVCTMNSNQTAPGGEGGEYASALIYVSGLSTSTALVIGSGGASVTATSTTPVVGNNGGDSSFAGLTALGGLGAAVSGPGPAKNWLAGKTGGEGGGDSPYNSPASTDRVTSGPGGSSVMGGGGGGAGGDVAAYSPAGTSQFAGNGGTGVFSAVSPLTGNNGSIPSGGGAGTRLNINGGTATSGAGARGQARLTWW